MKYEHNPAGIEKESFNRISDILQKKGIQLAEKNAHIIQRVIHTTADFDYVDNLYFSYHAAEKIGDAIKKGAHIVTDTNMCKAGINKKSLARFGGQVHCFIADPDVGAEASARGVTRAMVSMEKAFQLKVPVVFAIGNAPTALLRICELLKENDQLPAGVIGVPVGFVNVVESKEVLVNAGVTSIVARGRKGGSNVAAAICNAILYGIA